MASKIRERMKKMQQQRMNNPKVQKELEEMEIHTMMNMIERIVEKPTENDETFDFDYNILNE